MKKLLILLFFVISVSAVFAQPGSLSQSVYRSRVLDSAAAISANVTQIAAGYAPMFFNAQATTPHWDIWNGSSYDHVFDFNAGGGGGGTQDFQSVMDQGSSANIGDAQSTLTAQDASNYSQWNVTPSVFEMVISNIANTAGSTLSVDPDGVHVTDTRANRGLQGGADYSANITANDYTQKVYVDAADALKAPLASPTFTGTPAAPTASAGTSTTQLATTEFVTTADNLKANKQVTHNIQTGSNYTLVLTDADTKSILMRSVSAQTLTIPPNDSVAFPEGTMIIVTRDSTGDLSVVAGPEVTIETSAGNLLSPGQDSPMVLEKKNSTNSWFLRNGTPPLTAATGGTGADNTIQTYTPTLTNTANISASTARLCTYYRINNAVTVSGQIDWDPTTTLTTTTLGISLPVPSAFTTAFQLGGTASATTVSDNSAGIFSDSTNDRATLQYICIDVTNHTMTFTFTYQVL